jgi:hypothetical protein
MRKLAILSALVVAVALGLFAPRGPAAPALSDKPAKWEYAELKATRVMVAAPGAPQQPGGGVPAIPQVTVRWTTAEEELEEKGWDELANKLKAPAPKKDGSVTLHKLRVLNRLGADGWEIYEHTGTDGTTGTAAWTFRRRAP